MYTAEVHTPDGIVTIVAPTVDAMFSIIFHLNYDIFVNGIQVSAKDGKKPGCIGYYAGITRTYLAKIYETA